MINARLLRSVLSQASVQQLVDLERTVDINSYLDNLNGDSDDITEGGTNLYLTAAERTKLTGIEANATADQTDAEILSAWESESGITSTDVVERDGSVPFTGPVEVPSYTVAGLPSVGTAQIIYVSDETGGAVLAFSDGTNWRRVTDRAIVS